MRSKVTVLGDALLDVVVLPTRPAQPGADVPASVQVMPGGQGANVAVRLARLGAQVELLAAIGDDAAGAIVRSALEEDGVFLHPLRTAATGAVVSVVDAAGERTMLSQRAPFVADVVLALATRGNPAGEAGWTVVSGYLLLEPDADELAGAVRRRSGRCLLLGCALADERTAARWRQAAEVLEPDLLVLNRDEATAVDGLLADRRVVTDRRGAAARIGDAAAGVAVSEGRAAAVDTTGAGDAFAAALLAHLMGSWPPSAADLRRALEAAVEYAAAVTGTLGAQARAASDVRAEAAP